MLKKTIIAGLATGALIVGLNPSPAAAFEDTASVNTFGLEESSNTVFLFYDKMEAGDRFIITVGDNYYDTVSGYFQNATGTIQLAKDSYPVLKGLANKDKVNVQIVEPKKGTVEGQTKSFSFEVQQGSYLPTSMAVDQALLSKGGSNQDIVLRFDENYTPGFNDKVVYTPLDASGNPIKADIMESSVTASRLSSYKIADAQAFTYAVSPPKTAESYRIEFVTAGKVLDEFTQTVPVGSYFGTVRNVEIVAKRTVSLGEVVKPVVEVVDVDGNRRDVTAQASIVYSGNYISYDDKNRQVFTVDNKSENVGKSFIMTATYAGKADSTTFYIESDSRALKLDSLAGVTATDNVVNFQLQNKDGSPVKLDWKPTQASVSFKNASNTAASIKGSVTDMANMNVNGSGKLTLNASAPTEADLVIVFSDNNGNSLALEAGHYKFTAAQEKMTIIMGINSNKMLVNGQLKQIDTTPVISDNRTFVPLRALSEGFGAKVDFKDADQSVTITLGDKVVAMKNGDKTYTINGVAKTMDVAPYINNDSRIMVPVRFVAEALGFKVEASFNSDGTTANVLFSNN